MAEFWAVVSVKLFKDCCFLVNTLTCVTITYTCDCGIYVVIVSKRKNGCCLLNACYISLSRSFKAAFIQFLIPERKTTELPVLSGPGVGVSEVSNANVGPGRNPDNCRRWFSPVSRSFLQSYSKVRNWSPIAGLKASAEYRNAKDPSTPRAVRAGCTGLSISTFLVPVTHHSAGTVLQPCLYCYRIKSVRLSGAAPSVLNRLCWTIPHKAL